MIRIESNIPVHNTHPLQEVNVEEMNWEEEKKGFIVSMAGQARSFYICIDGSITFHYLASFAIKKCSR